MDVNKRVGELLEPLGDRILVRPETETEKMSKTGNIVIPETAQERPQVGVVAAIGAGSAAIAAAGIQGPHTGQRGDIEERVLTEDATGITARGRFRIGQRVVYGKFSGTEITVEQEQFIILRDDDVLAILHSAPASE